MAWRCTGISNEQLVQNLKSSGIISNSRVIQAMLSVDRGNYCPRYPYEDSPQSIGYSATISAPHMHGYALENLAEYLKPGMKVLDIGSGSGYLTACMAAMVGESGKVIGIEHVAQLTETAKNNVEKDGKKSWLLNGRLCLKTGDGRLGDVNEAPFDCIHVGAAAPETPDTLLQQLKVPGRMFIPVGKIEQYIYQYDKDLEGKVQRTTLFGVRYVPLTNLQEQLGP